MKAKTIPKKTIAIRESLFIKSFKLAKSNPNKVGLMILFDMLFLIFVFALNRLAQYFSQSIVVAQTLTSAIIFIIFSLIYYLIMLFAYSFFKYIILDYIKSLFEKTEISFKKLGQFYSLNIIIAGIFFITALIAGAIFVSIKEPYRIYLFFFLASPYWITFNIYSVFSLHSLIVYLITNISHSTFYQGASIKESLKKGFKITFTKIKVYREIILIMILFALLLWLLFLGSGYLIRFIASKNYNLYLNMYAYFKEISKWVATLVFYLVILINRVSFYAIIRESK